MQKSTCPYPAVLVDGKGSGVVSQAGGIVLAETVRATGLAAGLSAALRPWRKPASRHDPGKVITDLALSLAMGGDCLADVDRLRSQPGVFGPVASDPTVSRMMKALSGQQAAQALKAVNSARAAARAHAWALAGERSPAHGATARDPLVVDLDATLVTAHSEKEHAAPTWKKGYGFHPLTAFLDHGADGTGEPLAVLLRPGNAGSNTAADHIAVTRQALAQLPKGFRSGRRTMVRTDSAGGTKDFLSWLTGTHRNLGYSVGFPISTQLESVLPLVPQEAWARAYNSDGHERDGAWVAEATGMLDLSGWPEGMRVIVRREVPHVGAQLRITDLDGMRYTAFATRPPGSSPIWKSGTGCAPGARTASAAPRTQALRIFPCTPSTRTSCGAIWSCSPPRSPPGHRCSPSTMPPRAGGSPNGSAPGSSRLQPESAPTPAAPSCTWPRPRPKHR